MARPARNRVRRRRDTRVRREAARGGRRGKGQADALAKKRGGDVTGAERRPSGGGDATRTFGRASIVRLSAPKSSALRSLERTHPIPWRPALCATTHRRRRKAMATTRCGSIASSDERLRHTSKFARARWSSRRGKRGRYRRVARSSPARAERGSFGGLAPGADSGDTRPVARPDAPSQPSRPARRARRCSRWRSGHQGRRYFARAEPCLSRRTRVSA